MGTKKIDLHGIKHENVANIIIDVIEKHFDNNTLVTVVTGNSRKMKVLVLDVLAEYDITPMATFLETQVKFYT